MGRGNLEDVFIEESELGNLNNYPIISRIIGKSQYVPSIFDSNQNTHYLCTYHISSVRTINRNLSEPDRTFPPRRPLSLPALPSVLQRFCLFGVASPLRFGGAAAKVFLRRAPSSIHAPPRTGDAKRRDGVCPSPEVCQIRLTLLVLSSYGAFVQGG